MTATKLSPPGGVSLAGACQKRWKSPARDSSSSPIGQALPLAEILFGEIRHLDRVGAWDWLRSGQAGADDRRGRLMGAAQIAGHPHRGARQLFGEAGEERGLGAGAGKVSLAIDAAAMIYRRMPHQPEAGGARTGRSLIAALRDQT